MLRRWSNNTKTGRVPRNPKRALETLSIDVRPADSPSSGTCRAYGTIELIKTASDIIPPLHVVSIRGSRNNILGESSLSGSTTQLTAKHTTTRPHGSRAMTKKSWFFRSFLFPQSRPSRKSHNGK